LLISKIKKDLKGFLIYYNINTEEINHYELKKSLDLFILNLLSEISNIENSPLIISKLNTITKENNSNNNFIKTPIFYSLKNKIFYIDYLSYSNFNFNKPYIKLFKGEKYLIGDGF
jgi:hypothetical protein